MSSTPTPRKPEKPRWSPYDRMMPYRRQTMVPDDDAGLRPLPDDADDVLRRMRHPTYRGLDPKKMDQVHDLPFSGAAAAPLETATPVEVPAPVGLLKAGDSNMLDPCTADIYMSTSDVGFKYASMVYVIDHRVSDDSLVHYIIPSTVQPYNLREANARVLKRTLEVQRAALSFFRTGLRRLRQIYDADEWDLSDQEQRVAIYKYIWNRAPITLTHKMLGVTASVVDLDNIFYSGDNQTDDERRNWRSAFLSMFIYGAEAAFNHCPRDTASNEEKKLWYQDWRNMVRGEQWVEDFPFWTLHNLPVK